MGKRKTQEEFEKDVYERLGPDYELLGPYPGCHGKVPMKHLICGNIFNKNVHDIISKSSGCPFCNGTKPGLYNEQWVINNTPEPYSYVKGYSLMSKKCTFHCKICNIDFEQQPARLINQKIYGCNCQVNKKLTHEEFLEILGEDCLKEYNILDSYQNSDSKIHFQHKKCGSIFEQTPYKFIYRHNKKYCPLCYYKKSHGEIAILNYLEKYNIDYQKEFIFPDFPQARFDFYLPQFKTILEYDGIQHFKYNSFFHKSEEEFKMRQQADINKNKYCLNNNLYLFRIPYTEIDNIEQILKEILEEKSSTTIEKFLITEQSKK